MKLKNIDGVAETLSQGGRILVTRLQYLGDVILTLPLVKTLKTRFPHCEIDYLTKRPGVDLLEGEPAIKTLHEVPGPGEGVGATYRLMRRLRERRFTLAIDLFSNPRSAILVFSTGARVRIGGTRRIRKHFYTHTVRVPSRIRSAMAHHLYYLNVLGVQAEPDKPTVSISENERERAFGLLRNLGAGGGEVRIGIHPGGKWEVKRWPVDRYVSLVRRLKERLDAEVVVFRGPGEEGVFTDRLEDFLGREAVYLPELPVREAAAVMKTLDAGIFCDGGAMHLSVAVGTPTVGIFGSSEPDIWFPYEAFGPYRPAFIPIVCRPCHLHFCDHLSCLNGLGLDSVERTLIEVLDLKRFSTGAADPHFASNG